MSHLAPNSLVNSTDTDFSNLQIGELVSWDGSNFVNSSPPSSSFTLASFPANGTSTFTAGSVLTFKGNDSIFKFDTNSQDTVGLEWNISPTTGGTSQQVLIFDDNTDSYSWGAPISVASGSSSYLSYDNATRELSVSNLLITDVTTNAAVSITAYVATTPTHQSGDIVILPSATGGSQTWIHNGGSAGTTADYTQILDGASMSSFQFQADTGLPSTVVNGGTIKVLGGTGLASTQGTAGEITIDFSAAPTTGGSTKQILQFDDSGDTFSWVDKDTVGELLTFSNGLTRTLDDVELGGALTSATKIEVSSGNTLQISDGTSSDGWMFTKAPDQTGFLNGLSSPDLFLEFKSGSVATSLGSFGSTFYFTTDNALKIQAANNIDIESTEAVTVKGGDGVVITGDSSNVSIRTLTSGVLSLNSAANIVNVAATGYATTVTTGDIATTSTTGKIDFTAGTTTNIEAAGNIGIDSTAGDVTIGVITGANTIDIAAAGNSEAKLTSATGVVTVGASGAGTLVHQGAQVFPCSTKTASYTMVKGDYVILADGSSAVVTITLPASPQNGHIVNIKCIDDTNAVSITTPSTETIDGLPTYTFNYQYESITLVSDGSNWSII